MGKRSVHDSIVLRTVDIGEADRFCIVLTRDAGRRAARARGVRKPASRMGGALLPYARVRLELTEGRTGALVTSAVRLDAQSGIVPFTAFVWLQQVTELLLALTHDDEPMPEIFDMLDACILRCDVLEPSLLPRLQLRLLALLGVLPATSDDQRFAALCAPAKAMVQRSAVGGSGALPILDASAAAELSLFIQSVLADHLDRPLRSGTVAPSLEALV